MNCIPVVVTEPSTVTVPAVPEKTANWLFQARDWLRGEVSQFRLEAAAVHVPLPPWTVPSGVVALPFQ